MIGSRSIRFVSRAPSRIVVVGCLVGQGSLITVEAIIVAGISMCMFFPNTQNIFFQTGEVCTDEAIKELIHNSEIRPGEDVSSWADRFLHQGLLKKLISVLRELMKAKEDSDAVRKRIGLRVAFCLLFFKEP